jgi:histidyl-tRNA synthetase
MEELSTLTGKYGEEGDKLLFRILNSGDYLTRVPEKLLKEKDSGKLAQKITEKGLRYDLTVPFARFVAQYRNDIVFPFRRYQIQPVWRADRPQKGRYREFYQCDADIIGSDSLLNEAELIQLTDEVFRRLKIDVVIKINNRKILAGMAETVGEFDKITDITVAIDKLEKIGLQKVNEELAEKGVSKEAIKKLQPLLKLKGDRKSKIVRLETIFEKSEIGQKGVEEIKILTNYLEKISLGSECELDLTLARGLNYYTGAIIEVKATDTDMGSICGGGRYDNLTGIFGLPGVSGVGISFGAERIYDILEQRNLFPQTSEEITQVMFTNFGETEESYCLPVLAKVRQSGINAEIYPESAKMKKQLNYANRKQIPYVVLAGEKEIAENKFTLKNMKTGEQILVTTEKLVELISGIK